MSCGSPTAKTWQVRTPSHNATQSSFQLRPLSQDHLQSRNIFQARCPRSPSWQMESRRVTWCRYFSKAWWCRCLDIEDVIRFRLRKEYSSLQTKKQAGTLDEIGKSLKLQYVEKCLPPLNPETSSSVNVWSPDCFHRAASVLWPPANVSQVSRYSHPVVQLSQVSVLLNTPSWASP